MSKEEILSKLKHLKFLALKATSGLRQKKGFRLERPCEPFKRPTPASDHAEDHQMSLYLGRGNPRDTSLHYMRGNWGGLTTPEWGQHGGDLVRQRKEMEVQKGLVGDLWRIAILCLWGNRGHTAAL